MVYAGAAYADNEFVDCIAAACNIQDTYTVVGQSAAGCGRYYETCYECNGKWKIYDCHACPDGGTSKPGDNTEITKCYAQKGKDAAGGMRSRQIVITRDNK